MKIYGNTTTTHSVCPNCGTDNTQVVGEYRYNVEYDRHILKSENILRCLSCDLSFADPMPTDDILDTYYREIYRSKGRPHYIKDPPEPAPRHFSYIAYLTQGINFSEIKNILEVGAGWGEFGFLLKQSFPAIELYTIEPDKHTQVALKKNGYKIVSTTGEIKEGIDLIVSTHSLEHFNNINKFFGMFDSILKKGGYLFVEVPNCPFDNEFNSRPYDSPHLLFFNAKSLSKIAELRNYSVLSTHTTGFSFNVVFELCRKSKDYYENWTPDSPLPKSTPKLIIKTLIKSILPTYLLKILRKVRQQELQSTDFIKGKEDAWLIRGLFKKQSS